MIPSEQLWTGDVDALLEIGVRAAVIESPVSDGKLSAYGISREDLVDAR